MKFVWEDDPIYYSGSTPGYFIVDNVTSEKIYSGKFTKINGVNEPVFLNRFAQTIMEGGTIDFTSGVTQHPTMWKDLSIYEDRIVQRPPIKREQYVYAFCGPTTQYLSNPVNGKLDPRMKFFYSFADSAVTDVEEEVGYRDFDFSFTGNTIFGNEGVTRHYNYTSTDSNVIGFGTDEDWFTITKDSNNVFSITVTDNDSLNDRIGYFYITYPNENFELGYKYFEVSQGNNVYLSKYLTFEVLTGGTIVWETFSPSGDYTASKNLKYRINRGNWVSIYSSKNGATINVSEGDIVEFKGDNYTYRDSHSYCRFKTTAYVNLFGNIMSLVNSNVFERLDTIPTASMFAYFFERALVVSAKNLILPATTLKPGCYKCMFDGVYCLESAPYILPAETLQSECYYCMFRDCHYLEEAPKIKATTLAEMGCWQMFKNCSSLVYAPELLANYYANDCYTAMFENCTSLQYIKCMLGNGLSLDETWVRNAPQNGTFVKKTGSIWSDGIPFGWTVIEED